MQHFEKTELSSKISLGLLPHKMANKGLDPAQETIGIIGAQRLSSGRVKVSQYFLKSVVLFILSQNYIAKKLWYLATELLFQIGNNVTRCNSRKKDYNNVKNIIKYYLYQDTFVTPYDNHSYFLTDINLCLTH